MTKLSLGVNGHPWSLLPSNPITTTECRSPSRVYGHRSCCELWPPGRSPPAMLGLPLWICLSRVWDEVPHLGSEGGRAALAQQVHPRARVSVLLDTFLCSVPGSSCVFSSLRGVAFGCGCLGPTRGPGGGGQLMALTRREALCQGPEAPSACISSVPSILAPALGFCPHLDR